MILSKCRILGLRIMRLAEACEFNESLKTSYRRDELSVYSRGRFGEVVGDTGIEPVTSAV